MKTTLVEDVIATMCEGLELIREMSDEEFSSPARAFTASSVGAHYRHHLEHVRLLLDALESGAVIDYDKRERGGDVERQVRLAEAETLKLIERLRGLDEAALSSQVEMMHRVSLEGERPMVETTVARELMFMVSHAVHHYALMGIVAQAHGVCVGDGFGVMPSTLTYRNGGGFAGGEGKR